MNAAEIVIREVQGDGGFQVRQLLAERICKPRKSPHSHSHGQVLPLHKRSADVSGVGIALSDFGYNPRDAWWGVPRVGAVELPVVSKHLRELREVRIKTERIRNGLFVKMESVCRYLRAAIFGHALVQIAHEAASAFPTPLPDTKSCDQLSFRVHRNEYPLVSHFGRVSSTDVAPFLAHVAPNFVALQIPGTETAHSPVHQSGTAFASDKQESHDRVAVQSGKPFCAADRAPLQKTMQRTFRRVRLGRERIAGELGVGFRKSVLAGSAFPALDAALTEGTSFNAVRVLASDAGHGFSPLDFCGKKPHTHFGSGVRLTPRFGLAPTPVQAEAGVLIVEGYLARWINGYYHRGTVDSEGDLNRDLHCVPPFSRRAVLKPLRGSYLKSFILAIESRIPARLRPQLMQRVIGRNGRSDRTFKCLPQHIFNHIRSQCARSRARFSRPRKSSHCCCKIAAFEGPEHPLVSSFPVPLFSQLRFFVSDYALKGGMTGGERIAEIVKIELRTLERIADINGSQFLGIYASQQGSNCVSKARSRVVNHRKQLGNVPLLLIAHLNAVNKNANRLSQSRNFSIEKIAARNTV